LTLKIQATLPGINLGKSDLILQITDLKISRFLGRIAESVTTSVKELRKHKNLNKMLYIRQKIRYIPIIFA
jgi:hypothetical protein